MPEMNGLDALKEIMQICPVPVVMLSSTTQKGTENTLASMEFGAVDFVAKPSGTISLDLNKIQDELVHKVIEASKIPIAKLKKPIHNPPALTKTIVQPIKKDRPTGSQNGNKNE